MFTLRNVYNRPLNVELGAAFKEPVHVPAMGRVDVPGKLSDVDPVSSAGRYLKRRTLVAEETAPKESPREPQPVKPEAGEGKAKEPMKDQPVTITPAAKAKAEPATEKVKPEEKKG